MIYAQKLSVCFKILGKSIVYTNCFRIFVTFYQDNIN